MAVSVISSPINEPSAIRMSKGTITFDSSYPTGGEVVTAAQWGGGSNGLPNRIPDFVIFNGGRALDAADSDATLIATYTTGWGNLSVQGSNAAGTVQVFGDTATEGTGLDEIDSTVDAHTVAFEFIAFWFGYTVDPVTI